MKRALPLVAAACAAALASPHARAAGYQDDPWASLTALPESVDAAIVIEDLGDQLRSGQGRALTRFVAEAHLFEATITAWHRLARTLGINENESVEKLLGQRVTLAFDLDRPLFPGQLPGATWALVTEVDPPVAERVRKQLNAAPRRTVRGIPVLAIEDGRVTLAVIKQPGAPRPALVVAPRDASHLFETLIDAHTRPDDKPHAPRPGAHDPRAHAASTLAPGEIVGYLRAHALDEAAPTAGPASLLAFSATRRPRGWTADVLTAADPAECAPSPIDVDAFAKLTDDAIATVLFADASAIFNDDAGAYAFPIPRADHAPFAHHAPLMLALRAAPDRPRERPADRAPFTAQLVTALDPERGPALFDDLLATYLIPFAPLGQIPPGETKLLGFEGQYPGTPRVQRLRLGAFGLAQMVGQEAVLSWRYATTPDATLAIMTCAQDHLAPGQALAATMTERAARTLEASNPAPAAQTVLTTGHIRPSAYVRAIEATRPAPDPKDKPGYAALAWIDEIAWTLRVDPLATGDHVPVRGEVTLLTPEHRWADLGKPQGK